MLARNTFITLSAIATSFVATLSAEAVSDNVYYDDEYSPVPEINYRDQGFREAHPVKIYVKLANSSNRQKQLPFQKRTFQKIRRHLPDYAILVHDREYADITIKASERTYDLGFKIVDIDRKDKKYKKSRRYTGGRCGKFHKAYYQKVKEKGEAYSSYNLKIRMDGYGTHREEVRLKADDSFTYGRNLRASTNCGTVNTHHFPSNSVRELFYKSSDDYRRKVAREIRIETAENLGKAIVRQLRHLSDQHYSNLANRISYGEYRYSDSNYHRRDDRHYSNNVYTSRDRREPR